MCPSRAVVSHAIKTGLAQKLPKPEQTLDEFVSEAMWEPVYHQLVYDPKLRG